MNEFRRISFETGWKREYFREEKLIANASSTPSQIECVSFGARYWGMLHCWKLLTQEVLGSRYDEQAFSGLLGGVIKFVRYCCSIDV